MANPGASGLRGRELGRRLLPALGDTGRGGDGGWGDGTTRGPRLPLPKSEAHARLCLCRPRRVPGLPPPRVPFGSREPDCPSKEQSMDRQGGSPGRGRESRFCESTASVSLSVKQGWAEAGSGSTQKSWVRHGPKRGTYVPTPPPPADSGRF